MFKSWRWLDAVTKMVNVIESSIASAKDGPHWGAILFDNLNLSAGADLSGQDLEWWLVNADIIDPIRLREASVLVILLSGFRLLLENQSHIYLKTTNEPEHTTETVETIDPVIA